MLRVTYEDLYSALERAMLHLGLHGERATLCARLFAETTRDGVYTHGLNRFPRFAEQVRNGSIDVDAAPSRISEAGALERWDGNLGPGNLNAYAAMQRAMTLAREQGLGGVALANTNHWMRGGSYGWLAAEEGLAAICWTNTMANLPPWGSSAPVLGNNPLVIAIPRGDGAHVVLDMAMSQYSYGTLAEYRAEGKQLPVPGGYDSDGRLSCDPAAIEASQRALAIGYWKGSGLSLVLDMLAAMLCGGKAAHEIAKEAARESGMSQIFLAVDPSQLAVAGELDRIANGVIESLRRAMPIDAARAVRYPGEQTLQRRKENMRLGVPVDSELWEKLQGLSL